jgi:hypothetical protein
MVEIANDSFLAPKIAFVAADPAVVSDDFLERCFLQGYECYAIPFDSGGRTKARVQLLIESFHETILFFTIDRRLELNAWVDYIRNLQNDYGGRTRIGVVYGTTDNDAVQARLSETFLWDIGIQAGCIALSYSYKKNQSFLLEVLSANDAGGRRKVIRLNCGATYRLNVVKGNEKLQACLLDLSISHLSAQFLGADPGFDVGSKVPDVQLNLGGALVLVNLRTALKRVQNGQLTYVFVFQWSRDQTQSSDYLQKKVNAFIFREYQKSMTELFSRPEEAEEHAVPALSRAGGQAGSSSAP